MGCSQSKEAYGAATQNPANAGAGNTAASREEQMSVHLAAKRGAKRENVMNAQEFDPTFAAPVYPKTKAQEELIRSCITGPDACFFVEVGEAELTLIINACEPRSGINKGDELIVQGDPGDYFYIVEDGKLSAFVNGKKVKDYSSGMFFGELALAYNKPRAATIKAESSCKVFALSAKVFRRVVAQSAKSRYESILAALQEVSLLWNKAKPSESNVTFEQLARVAEIVSVAPYKAGDTILRKGTLGSLFYMISSGHVVVKNKGTTAEAGAGMSDSTLGPGTYFGERALMMDEPRAADVIAKTDCVLLCLDRKTFQEILGSLKEVIHHNANMRLLDSVQLFQLLTKKEKRAVYDNFMTEKYKKGASIVVEGDVGTKFFIMKEGQAIVKKGGVTQMKDGKPVTRYPGQHFGEMALMRDEPRSATIEAQTDCEVLTMERKEFIQLVGIKDVHDKFEKMIDAVNATNSSMLNLKFTDLKQLAVLGSGTFGRVTLVQSMVAGADGSKGVYALKAMLKSEIVMHKQQDNVMNEKNCMVGCNHPFILKLYQTFKDSQKLYMLLEFVQGGELFSVLHPAHPVNGMDGVSNEAAQFYAAGVLLAIAYLHNERNIAYRDMKPENCLIDSKGYPKLVDFGFAKVITSKSYTLCGTPEYLAPELVLGRGHNKSVDYWAFGIMIYEMQAGYSPFSDANMDQTVICRNIIKAKLDFDKGFDPDCKSLVKALLSREVNSRLGNLKGGTDDIKNHKWWSGFDWKGYYEQKKKAPMVPAIKGITDTSHFDPYAADDHVIDPSYKDTGNWDKDF